MKRSIALTLAVLAAACTEKAPKGDSATATTAAAPAAAAPAAAPATPTVMIVSPKENDSTSRDVTVVLSSKNVTIAKADGQKTEGTGHYHLFLDTAPAMDSMPIPPTTKTVVHLGTGDSTFTYKGLKPGAHTIIAVIGYGNHVPMPGVTDTVHIVVKP